MVDEKGEKGRLGQSKLGREQPRSLPGRKPIRGAKTSQK